MKNVFLFFRNRGGWNLILLFLLNLIHSEVKAQQEVHIIELGISYDQSLDNEFTSVQDANEKIMTVVDRVNEIYNHLFNTSSYLVYFQPTIRKVNVYLPPDAGLVTWNLAVSNNWNSVSNECNKFDLVHHFTLDLDGVVGHKAANGLCNNKMSNYGKATATISEYRANTLDATAHAMAHELGHNLGMSHDPDLTSLMFENLITQPIENYTISNQNRISFKSKLSGNPCTQEPNVNIQIEGCISCDDNVYFSNSAPLRLFDVEFGCNTPDLDYDIESIISNGCAVDYKVKLQVFINDQHISLTEISEIYTGPYSIIPSLPYKENVYYETGFMDLKKAQSLVEMFKVHLNGTGEYIAPNHETRVNVFYKFQYPYPPGISAGLKNVDFRFRMNYQLDKSALSYVKASELVTPDINFPNDFCNGVKHDIYLNGTFEVDIDKKYCNTNFYFSPGTKVVVNPGINLKLENCTMTTCDEGALWSGIELSKNSSLELKKSSISKAGTAISASDLTTNVSITNGSTISYCNYGIKLLNASLYPLQKSTFSHCTTAISLTDCPIVQADGCAFKYNRVGMDATNTNLISTSDFVGAANSKGIVHNGTGHELFIPSGSFEDMQSGVVSNYGKLHVGSTLPEDKPSFRNNFIGVYKGFSPGIGHKIVSSSFEGNDYGVLISQNSSGLKSYITGGNVFNQNKYAISISNTQPAAGNGWEISDNDFKVAHIGIKSSRSDYVDIWGNTFEASPAGRGYALKDMISLEGGIKNKIRENTMTHQVSMAESEQMRNIYVANAFNTQVHCNILNNGTYGLNVWGAAPSLISANTFTGSHTGIYYGLYPNNGNVVTGPQSNHGNIWEKNPPFLSTFGAKHLNQDPQIVNQSRYIVDELENPKFNTNESAVTDWIQDFSNPAISNNCANPPLSGTSGNAGGSTGSGAGSGSGSGGTMALSISNGDVPFTDYSVPLNQALDQQLYISVLNGDNTGLNTSQIKGYSTTMSNTLIGTLSQANYLMSPPIAGSTQVSAYSDQIHTLMEAYYTAETNNDPSASSIRSQINTLTAGLSTAYQIYLTNLYNRIDQVQANISPLLTSSDPYIYAQANVMQLSLKQLKGDSLNVADITKLTQIANMCPLEGGDAVYGARGILESHLLTTLTYNDHQLCNISTPRVKTTDINTITIYPNPSTSIVHIINTTNVESLEIFDQFGIVVMHIKNQNKSESLMIDLSDQPSGVFIVKQTNRDRSKSSHKLILIK